MSSNESEDFEDPETEQTQVYQSDQDEMHFYQDEKLKDVGSAESVVAKNRARSGRDGPSDGEYFLIILFVGFIEHCSLNGVINFYIKYTVMYKSKCLVYFRNREQVIE